MQLTDEEISILNEALNTAVLTYCKEWIKGERYTTLLSIKERLTFRPRKKVKPSANDIWAAVTGTAGSSK